MTRITLYKKLLVSGEGFKFYLPGVSDAVYMRPGQKIEITASESTLNGFSVVKVERITQEGYTARPDEWWPET